QHGRVLGQELPVIHSQHRHLAHRVDRQEVRSVREPFGPGVYRDEAALDAGFVKRDSGGHRARQWREIKIHESKVSFGLIFVPYCIKLERVKKLCPRQYKKFPRAEGGPAPTTRKPRSRRRWRCSGTPAIRPLRWMTCARRPA